MTLTVLQLVKIHLMGIKCRTVNTGELALSVNHHTAYTAKPYSVEHHHVEDAPGRYRFATSGFRNAFHHVGRPCHDHKPRLASFHFLSDKAQRVSLIVRM